MKWNRQAAAAGERHRVFCASLADVWDNEVPQEWRTDLFHLIWETKNLDWLLLTKRVSNILKMLPASVGELELWPWPNVWLGITCGDGGEYERDWPRLSNIPATIRFISYEPAIGPLNTGLEPDGKAPDWIICGGESGPRARYMEPQWAANLLDDCRHLGIAFFMKQMTGKAPIPPDLMVREFPR